jgi:hypothetical protein
MKATERRNRALDLLGRFKAVGSPATWTPAWSSRTLEEAVAEILSAEGASVGDLLAPLWEIAGRAAAMLTPTVANFIRDIVVLAFTRYRALYEAEDFRWLAEGVRSNPTPSQAYLALLALPEDLAEESKASIFEALKGTQFFDEAQKMMG